MSTSENIPQQSSQHEAPTSASSSVESASFTVADLCEQLLADLSGRLSTDYNWATSLSSTLTLFSEKIPDIVKGGFYVWKQDKLELGAELGTANPQQVRGGYGVLGSVVALRSAVVRPETPEHGSEIALPVLDGTRFIGVLDLSSTLSNRFSESDREHLQRFVSSVSKLISWPADIGVEAEHSTSIKS